MRMFAASPAAGTDKKTFGSAREAEGQTTPSCRPFPSARNAKRSWNPGEVFWLAIRPTRPGLPAPSGSGRLGLSSSLTAAGPRRICTAFPVPGFLFSCRGLLYHSSAARQVRFPNAVAPSQLPRPPRRPAIRCLWPLPFPLSLIPFPFPCF